MRGRRRCQRAEPTKELDLGLQTHHDAVARQPDKPFAPRAAHRGSDAVRGAEGVRALQVTGVAYEVQLHWCDPRWLKACVMGAQAACG